MLAKEVLTWQKDKETACLEEFGGFLTGQKDKNPI